MTTTLADVRADVARMEGKLDTFLRQMQTQDERTTSLTERLGKVESRQHWYSGFGAALGVIFGIGSEHALK